MAHGSPHTRSGRGRALCAALAVCAGLATASPAPGQRVQIPATSGAPESPPPATFSAPPSAPAFDPYTTGDPYAGGAPLGAPPATVPYTYAQPPASSYAPASPYPPPPPAAAQPEGLWPDQSPMGWESGTYGYRTPEGSVVRFSQLLQQVSGEHTYLYGNHSADSLEINRLELTATFAFPLFGNVDAPLLLTPGFAFNWLEGPSAPPSPPYDAPDLPPRVYDAYLDAAWFPQPTEHFGAELGVRTGVWTDFQEVNGDSVRVLGRGLAKVRVSPRLELLAGVVYLDRVRIKLLPAGGVRFRPTEQWDIYLVFPNPRIRRELYSTGAVDWAWFASGEYGGGSWTVERVAGGDRIDYNDIRISTGFEWMTPRQARGHFEVGVVFDREVLFHDTQDPPRFTPDTTVMLRTGLDY